MFSNKKNYINKFILLSSYLIILLPFAQITGPFLTDLTISLCALSYLIIIIIFNNNLHVNNNYLNILFVFWIFIFICAIVSDHKNLSVLPSSTFFRFILFSFAAIFIIKNCKNFLKKFNISLIIVLIILIFDGYFQFIYGKNIIGLEKLRPDRLSSFFHDELILGSFLFKFLPLIIFLFYENIQFKKIKYLNLLIIIFIIPLIFLSGERAAFFMSILFCIIVMPFLFSFKNFILIFFSFSILSLVVINSNTIVYDRYVNQLKDHLIKKKGDELIYFPEHIGLFNSAYNNFLNNKFIGSGIKSFRETCKLNNSEYKNKITKLKPKTDFCSTHPHNYYLQFLTELGLVGFLFLVATFIFCITKYFKSLLIHYFKHTVDKLLFKKYNILLCGFITFLWPLTTSGNFFNNYNSSFIFLNLSFFLYIYNEYVFKNKK